MIDDMNPAIEALAKSVMEVIPEPWTDASVHAIFSSDSIHFEGDYSTRGGRPKTLDLGRKTNKGFQEIRRLFREARRPLWGQAQLILTSDGKFSMKWGYDKCDADGKTLWDDEDWKRWHDERHKRLGMGL